MAEMDLAEAERKVREFAAEGCDCNHYPVYELEALLAEYDRRGEALAVLRELVELEYDSPRVRGHKTWRRAYVLVRAAIPAPAASEPGGEESNDDPDASTAERRLPSPMLEPTSFDDTETEDELVPAPAASGDEAARLDRAARAARFREKSVEIEAHQWTPGDPEAAGHVAGWISSHNGDCSILGGIGSVCVLGIRTLEGVMEARPGDWVIRGVKGEFYPIKDSIFRETYEPVEGVDGQAALHMARYADVVAERDSARRERDHAHAEVERLRAEVRDLTAARDRVLALCDRIERVFVREDWHLSLSEVRAALAPRLHHHRAPR